MPISAARSAASAAPSAAAAARRQQPRRAAMRTSAAAGAGDGANGGAPARRWSLATQLVHTTGYAQDPYAASMPPIYQTATFQQPDAIEMGEYDYSRSGNPTRTVLERMLAQMEVRAAAGLRCGLRGGGAAGGGAGCRCVAVVPAVG